MKMRRYEDILQTLPLLEELCAQTLSGIIYLINWVYLNILIELFIFIYYLKR